MRLAGKDEVKRRAGVDELGDLRNKPLEECDRLAHETELFSQVFATVQGAVTGAGGVLTTLIDIPLLFVLSLRTILKVGHCYGYSLDRRRDQHFVFGVLIAAVSGTLATKRHRLDRLHELEDWLIQDTHEEILAEEVMSILFQLEVFAGIPGIGAISGARAQPWRDASDRQNSPARVPGTLAEGQRQGPIGRARAGARRDLAGGWAGALGRLAYSGCYGLGYGVALPVSVLLNRLAGPPGR